MVVLYLLINGPGKWSLDALLASLPRKPDECIHWTNCVAATCVEKFGRGSQ
jgi:hypothetical protein